MFHNYIILIRPHHWIKNVLIFFPVLLSPNVFNYQALINSVFMFICFCLVASGVYIFNDIKDAKLDSINIRTKNRPIASGDVSQTSGYILALLILGFAFLLAFILVPEAIYYLLFYIVINILYTLYFKYLIILDILSVSSGFLCRIIAGGIVAEINQTSWTLLIITFASISLATGKRLGQFIVNPDYLSAKWSGMLLKCILIVSICFTLIFYGLFSYDPNVISRHGSDNIWISFPPLIVIFLRYLYIAWNGKYLGDPTDVILKDWPLKCMAFIWGILIFYIFII